MKRALVLMLLLAGCETTGGSPQEEERKGIVRRAFDDWNAKVAAGDVPGVYRGISSGMKSNWLLQRLTDRSDPITPKHVARLDEERRKVLDAWRDIQVKNRVDRATLLPEALLNSTWLFELFKEVFEASQAVAQTQAWDRRVTQVYVDATGVTIMTLTQGVSELYVMVAESDGWKVDGNRVPPRWARSASD